LENKKRPRRSVTDLWSKKKKGRPKSKSKIISQIKKEEEKGMKGRSGEAGGGLDY